MDGAPSCVSSEVVEGSEPDSRVAGTYVATAALSVALVGRAGSEATSGCAI